MLLFLFCFSAAIALLGIHHLDNDQIDVRKYASSLVVTDRDNRILNVSLSEDDEWCMPISLDQMGRWTPIAALQIEDKRFYRHGGIDCFALVRAFFSNLRSKRVVSGASTITSQLVRISHPRERTYKTKLLEFWHARKVENALTKDEILELYLNRAPFGGNLRGIEAASRAYLGKPAQDLTLAESTLLLSLLRAPSRLRPDRYPAHAKELRNRNISIFYQRGIISRENLEHALAETVLPRRYPMPRNASMACTEIRRRTEKRDRIVSTLSERHQYILEKNIRDMLENLPSNVTGAGILVENSTKEVLAYVGNARHGSGLPGSQVDCAIGGRSPGSTLKPFIYAEAFERGLLSPATLLADTPLSFRGSAPRNFDLSYRGPVSARTALASSLNAPAVRVLRMIGYPRALNLYRQLGFAHFTRDASFYADSLVLGGCEVTLQEVADAYLSLACGGQFVQASWTRGASGHSRPVFSAEASYLTISILLDERRLTPLYQQLFQEQHTSIAFKTGTSYGLRDAWCAGLTPTHTLVVWFGSPSGDAHPSLVGLDTAAHVLLRVFRDIKEGTGEAFKSPNRVIARDVCSLSGGIPGKGCRSVGKEIAIADITPHNPCGVHKIVDGKPFLEWPPELASWLQLRERADNTPPGVRILTPLEQSKIILPEHSRHARVAFSAEGMGMLYWYLDGKFIGKCIDEEKLFYDVLPGPHRLSVICNEESDSLVFEVLDPLPEKREQHIDLLN